MRWRSDRRTATWAARCGSAPIRRCSNSELSGLARSSPGNDQTCPASAPIRRCSTATARCRRSTARPKSPSATATRYEVNTAYKGRLEQHGMRFCGMSPDGVLPEIIEYEDHPWFIGVQYHPELKSRPFAPHPLFASFVEAAVEQSRLV